MFIIGLTGGIACGKSAISVELKKLGAKTFDVDRETHKLLQQGEVLYRIYVEHFGSQIVLEDGSLNKRLIGEIIFHDAAERHWINSIAHPILLNKMRQILIDCQKRGDKVVVLEIPLLFEAGWDKLVDEVWAIYLPVEFQIYRLVRRDKITPAQAAARIAAQMPAKTICSKADVVINNKGTREQLQKKILSNLKGRL